MPMLVITGTRHVEQLSQQLSSTEATFYDSLHRRGIEICSTILCNSILIYLFQFGTNYKLGKRQLGDVHFLRRLNHFFVLD